MSKSLAASLHFCWSRVIYKIFNISESACADTIIFYMSHLPLSYQLDLCRLRFYHYISYNFLSGDEIMWHVANAVKRRLIDQLFCSYRIYIFGSMAFAAGLSCLNCLPMFYLNSGAAVPCSCVCYVIMLW